jgi:ribosomal protein S18
MLRTSTAADAFNIMAHRSYGSGKVWKFNREKKKQIHAEVQEASVERREAERSTFITPTTKQKQQVDDEDAPIELNFDPYEKPCHICFLCRHNIQLDYKNPRLLQQYVSTFSGRVYDRHVTALCSAQHSALLQTVALSRRAGYMPIMTKDPKYLRDPKLFNPLRPIRPHSYDDLA